MLIPTALTGLKTVTRGDVRFGELMSKHTSFNVGGPVDALVLPEDFDDVISVLRYSSKMHVPVLIIGGGTNLLIGDLGLRGIALKIGSSMNEIHWDGYEVVTAGGFSLPRLIKESTDKNLSGIEHCFGIPGTIGGAVAMNAGTSSHYISQSVAQVGYITLAGDRVILDHNQMQFDYRSSLVLRSGGVIEWVRFRFNEADSDTLAKEMNRLREYRSSHQPTNNSNAGCIFRNPPGRAAGQLIEETGFKGVREGGIAVSDVHANFLVNMGSGTSQDVLNLMTKIIDEIYLETNVRLQPEVRIIGSWSGKQPDWL